MDFNSKESTSDIVRMFLQTRDCSTVSDFGSVVGLEFRRPNSLVVVLSYLKHGFKSPKSVYS